MTSDRALIDFDRHSLNKTICDISMPPHVLYILGVPVNPNKSFAKVSVWLRQTIPLITIYVNCIRFIVVKKLLRKSCWYGLSKDLNFEIAAVIKFQTIRNGT